MLITAPLMIQDLQSWAKKDTMVHLPLGRESFTKFLFVENPIIKRFK